MKTFSPLKLPKTSDRTPFETTEVGGARFDASFQVKSRPGYNFWLQVVSPFYQIWWKSVVSFKSWKRETPRHK